LRKYLWLFILATAAHAQIFTYAGGSQTPIPASYFGIFSTHIQTTSPAVFQVGTLGLWDTSYGSQAGTGWNLIETSSGTYVWTGLDAIVSIAQSNSIPDLMYVIGNVPSWNSSNPSDSTCAEGNGTCDPNASTSEFVTYMNAVTQRYCGAIQYWEGWNEASTSEFWNASISLLVTYMQAYYTAVHSTTNCACVGSFSTANCSPAKASGVNLNQVLLPPLNSPALFTATELNNGSSGYNINISYWLQQFLAAGGGATYDIAALHSYGSSATCYTGGPEQYVVDVAGFKQTLVSAGLSPTPVWATELNFGLNTCVSGSTAQDAWIARYYLLHWAIGVQRAIWYTYDAVSGNNYGLISPSTNQLTTYQEMQKWMTSAVETSCQQFGNSNWSCNFTRSSPTGYQAYAVWNSTGSGSYTVPAGVVQYRNVLNTITTTTPGTVISLTTSPLLFETVSGAF
jgi:hypothetical protein